jgi:hypothetical protein
MLVPSNSCWQVAVRSHLQLPDTFLLIPDVADERPLLHAGCATLRLGALSCNASCCAFKHTIASAETAVAAPAAVAAQGVP